MKSSASSVQVNDDRLLGSVRVVSSSEAGRVLSVPEIKVSREDIGPETESVYRINDTTTPGKPFVERITLDEINKNQSVMVSVSKTSSMVLVAINVGHTWKTVHGYMGLDDGGITSVTRVPSGPHTVGVKSSSGKFWTVTYAVIGDEESATIGPLILSPD